MIAKGVGIPITPKEKHRRKRGYNQRVKTMRLQEIIKMLEKKG